MQRNPFSDIWQFLTGATDCPGAALQPDQCQIGYDAGRESHAGDVTDRRRKRNKPQRAAVKARDGQIGPAVAVEIGGSAECQRT